MQKEELLAIGKRLRKARNQRKLTQEAVADLLGVSLKYYSEVKRGLCGMSYGTLIKMRGALGVSIDYLLTGELAPSGSPISELYNTCPQEKKAYLDSIIENAVKMSR